MSRAWIQAKEEMTIVQKIGLRAHQLNPQMPARQAAMEVSIAHEVSPLRLQDLLDADDMNFAHDVFGINRHLDHATGELQNCFSPRFARRG